MSVPIRPLLKANSQLDPLPFRTRSSIHHYISSHQARQTIDERLGAIAGDLGGRGEWFAGIEVSEGILLPESVKLTEASDPAMWDLCDRYYDHGLYEQLKEHLEAAGQKHIRHGYGDSALPVVLEHNCPNNAITVNRPFNCGLLSSYHSSSLQ